MSIDNDTSLTLGHYFAQKVAGVLVVMSLYMDRSETVPADIVSTAQQGFVQNLERMLARVRESTIAITPGIAEPELRELLSIAREYDWSQPATIQQLYDTYGRIAGKNVPANVFETAGLSDTYAQP